MLVEELLEYLECVGAVAAAAVEEVGGAELGVFDGVVRDAVRESVSFGLWVG